MSDRFAEALQAGQEAGARYRLQPPRTVAAGVLGEQLANRPGSSIEFMDHRSYQVGDDLRRVDWAAYARTRRLIVKRYREEATPHVDVLIDATRSMNLPGSDKAPAALGLAAVLAAAASNAGFSCAVYRVAEDVKPLAPANQPPAAWQLPEFDFAGTIEAALARPLTELKPRALRVLISDLLWPGDPDAVLRPFAQGAATPVLVQVLGEDEVRPPRRGSVRLVDAETGRMQSLFIDAATQRRYEKRLADHQNRWRQAARQVDASVAEFVDQSLIGEWDLKPLIASGVLTFN